MADEKQESTTLEDTKPKDGEAETPEADDVDKKIEKYLHSRLENCKRLKKDLSSEWKRNVDLRMGRIANAITAGVTGTEDDIQTEINPDWSLTKVKTSNLFSQIPEVQGSHENKQYEAAVPLLLKSLNYEIGSKRANLAAPMEEAMNDAVNAAGVAAIYLGYEATTETKKVPLMDGLMKMLPPKVLQAGLDKGLIPSKDVDTVVDAQFFACRISPMDLLWATEFNGSNFDDSDLVGNTGRMPWARAKNEFKLEDEDKEAVVGAGEATNSDDSMRSNTQRSNEVDTKSVKYDQLFYWRCRFDPEEKFFKSIWRIVWVHGKDEPVIHEPYKGQKLVGKHYMGVRRFPIQVLTLTYITDNPIPPSDSSAMRPQVNDLRRSRQQMFLNRERSTPLRWFNPLLVDPLVQDSMMRGTVQGWIPTLGDGGRAVGEVARASYPQEDQMFDLNTKQDIMEGWQLMPTGIPPNAKLNKGEQAAQQATMASRLSQERNRVAAFFLNICDVMLGLMVLYSDFPVLTDQEKAELKKAWDATKVTHDLVLKVRPDSTIVLDSNQRLDKIFKFMNFTVKSGMVNPKPLLVEAAELSGIDPADVVVDPKPPKPADPNVSYRFSGKQDISSPAVMALLIKAGLAPSPEELEAAKVLLTKAQLPPAPPAQPGAPVGPGQPPVPPPTGGGSGAPAPGTPEAHPHWSLGGRIAKRNRDANGG